MLGLLQSSFGLTGYDALIHCADELPEPRLNVPRAMIAAICKYSLVLNEKFSFLATNSEYCVIFLQ